MAARRNQLRQSELSRQLVSRRTLLLGAAGLAGSTAMVSACAGSEPSSGPSSSTRESGADEFVVLPRFPNDKAFVPGQIRLAVSLANSDASLLTEGPERLTGLVRDESGATLAPIDAIRRGKGHGVPYWSITANVASRGLYDLLIDGATGDPQPFLVWDANELTMPATGTALPPFDTPTTSDARGVDPICTRLEGQCPFHDLTLTEALDLNKPVIYIIGTPAHCETATCGPGLEFLIEAASTYAGKATFVHADVYADPAATVIAPAVEALALTYEPLIFITDAAGTIVERIDIVWDAQELGEILAATFS